MEHDDAGSGCESSTDYRAAERGHVGGRGAGTTSGLAQPLQESGGPCFGKVRDIWFLLGVDRILVS